MMYIVVNADFNTVRPNGDWDHTLLPHETLEAAVAQADALAKKSPGYTYYVMQAIGTATTNNATECVYRELGR